MRRASGGLLVGLLVGLGWSVVAQETPLTPIANLRGRTNSSGYLLVALSPSPAPTGAQYWVGAADGDLTGEHNLGALSTGLVLNTAGTPTAYAGSSTCTGSDAIQTLSASGVATCVTAGSGAPTDAQYWTGAANATLSAEKNLGALSTALVINTAGVPSAYAGIDCTNQVVVDVSVVGAGTCVTVTTAYTSGIAASGANTDITSLTGLTAAQFATGGVIRGTTTSTNTWLAQAYDNDTGPAYVSWLTVTNGNSPSATFSVPAGGMTVNWQGTPIAFAYGGTGLAAAADDTAMISSGSAWEAKAVTNCTDTGGNHLNYTASTNSFSCGTSSGGGALTLLKANSGTSTNATNPTNVDTVSISGLTANDTLVVYVNATSVTQATGAMVVANTTDGVNLLVVEGSSIVAGTGRIAQGFSRQSQAGVTAVHSWGQSHDLANTVDTVTGRSNTFTDWTGSWTLALQHEGVTGGGTLRWSWAVYKVAGQ